jgi:hypothetical protein
VVLRYAREFEDESGFAAVHARFEAAFVEGAADGVDARAVAAQRDEAGSTLWG